MELLAKVFTLLLLLVAVIVVVDVVVGEVEATMAAGANNTNSPFLSIPVLPIHLFCNAMDWDVAGEG